MLEWFSIQLPVISDIFKLSLNLSLTHLRAQSAWYELKRDFVPFNAWRNTCISQQFENSKLQGFVQKTIQM